jgi:hypothetical protein
MLWRGGGKKELRGPSRNPAVMRRASALAASLFLIGFACLSPARSREATCVLRVPGGPAGTVFDFHADAGGPLIGAEKGLFRYRNERIDPVPGAPATEVNNIFDSPSGLLLNTGGGLFRLDGDRAINVKGDPGYVDSVLASANGFLVGAENGLFRYDGDALAKVGGAPTGEVTSLLGADKDVLVGADKGLFAYRDSRAYPIADLGRVKSIHETSNGPLIAAGSGLFRYDGTGALRVEGGDASGIEAIYDAPGGPLVSSLDSLFRYDGAHVVRIEGAALGYVHGVLATPRGILVASNNGLFRVDGVRLIRLEGGPSGDVNDFLDTPDGLLLGSAAGLFRYDGAAVSAVGGDPTGEVKFVRDTPRGTLVGADNGLFRYEGGHVARIASEPTGAVEKLLVSGGAALLAADNGVFQLVAEPLSAAKIHLENALQLKGAAPNKLGVPTRWSMTHPCAAFAEQFSLFVVAANAKGEVAATSAATAFQPNGDSVSFEATVPVADDGDWIFRVVSLATGTQTDIGAPAAPIAFVTPGVRAVLDWLAVWWKQIAAYSAVVWTLLNLITFGAARYSATAWRMATDEFWGQKALVLQNLLLRYWRGAQLWLLDLYVQEQRKAAAGKTPPYLSLPLADAGGQLTDSDAVLARLPSVRHLWVQGGPGMGKTSLFQHLRQAHFGGAQRSAFSIFRRDRYVLVPIQARRFPQGSSEEKGASGWVVASALSVLSEGSLTLEDRSLLRAMLNKGTLALVIDGLNEVGRGEAVNAFAAEFPRAPLLVTSQELGEPPFETWRLPRSIADHVDGLLTLYLGEQRGAELANRLRASGLMQYLRSGYDVRLVTDLAESQREGDELPKDRIGLYRAAVAAGWPEGDQRLELLQAAAWKLMSARGPNEDKRRLKPDADAPADLLEQLEAVREQSGRSIRLVRAAPPGYEFVHDQMNAYLAACWLSDRPTLATVKDALASATIWQDGLEAQRTIWGFLAAMLDRARLEALWIFAGDDDRRAVLGRALAERAEREGWTLTRPPAGAAAQMADGRGA